MINSASIIGYMIGSLFAG